MKILEDSFIDYKEVGQMTESRDEALHVVLVIYIFDKYIG